MLASIPRNRAAGDQALFGEALSNVVDGIFPAADVGDLRSFGEVRSIVKDGGFDLIFVDVIVPGPGLDALRELPRLHGDHR